jgi:hypothetical protein
MNITHQSPQATKNISHDGVLLNGMLYSHPALLRYCGKYAAIFKHNLPNTIAVYVDAQLICIAQSHGVQTPGLDSRAGEKL